MPKSSLKDKIKKLSKSPGVYVFKDKNGAVLYVGKATSLQDRVKSYFSTSPSFFERPVDYAISQIADVKIIKTDTVLESYILEQNLIKKLQPKYNAMGKDDKSFSYVLLTKETFPRFVIMRKTEVDQISNSSNYLISNKIPNYKSQITNKFQISKSKSNKILNTRYKIQYTRIFGPYVSKKNIEIVLKLLRKIFPYHNLVQKTEKGCLDFELGRCPGPYAGEITRADYLKNIRGIQMILEGKKNGLVKKLGKEMKAHSKNHEYEKAADVRNKLFALRHIQDIALISEEKNILDTKYQIPDTRIEAYDISNISGDYAVGSMVVFSGNKPNKDEYRKFKIKTVKGADDIGMMKEVLMRRFNNNWPASTRGDSSTRGWPKPDLILLDGGIGHLNMAERLLKDSKLNIPLAAVAKGVDRKKLEVHGLQPKDKEYVKDILDNKKLLKRIMDEAHRFAITYHKKVRKREFITA